MVAGITAAGLVIEPGAIINSGMTSNHTPPVPRDDLPQRLQEFCDVVTFAPDAILRQKGQHYSTMFLVTAGRVEVDLGQGSGTLEPPVGAAGLAIGEIGFLRGLPATATVRALSEVTALKLDDEVLSQLERTAPDVAVALLRFLAETAEERTSQNIQIAAASADPVKEQSIRVLLCRNDDMLVEAQQLRYQVYCQELGRTSPHAHHDKKIISDDLDRFGQTFIAVEDGKAIGTLRANRPSEGPVGMLEELYNMPASEFHPDRTIVCTKFVIRNVKRTSAAGIKLGAAFARHSVQHNVRECYIDCIPSLRPYSMAIGFRTCGEKFLHRENGPSYPLKVDLEKSMSRIERILFTSS